jgi:hypothetical protein
MIYLGSIMIFRWEKYRFVSQYESFLAFQLFPMIAECCTFKAKQRPEDIDILTRKAGSFE